MNSAKMTSLALTGPPTNAYSTSLASVFINIGRTLQSLSLCALVINDKCLIEIARLCPGLKLLGFVGTIQPSTAAMIQVCTLCPSIEHLYLRAPNDACVAGVTRILKLQTLNIETCQFLTNAAVRSISENLRGTLISLSVHILNCPSFLLSGLVVHCLSLKHLEFSCHPVLEPTYLTGDFLCFMGRIETLSIKSTREGTPDSVVNDILQGCRSLLHLRLDTSKRMSVALTSLVKKCPRLRTLALKEVNVKKRHTWQLINPQLHVEAIDVDDEESKAFRNMFIADIVL